MQTQELVKNKARACTMGLPDIDVLNGLKHAPRASNDQLVNDRGTLLLDMCKVWLCVHLHI